MKIFSKNLRELILDKDISIAELSKASRVSRVQISRYLHKNEIPTLKIANRLANYFDCSLDYLFGLSEDRSYPRYVSKEIDLTKFLDKYQEALRFREISNWKFCKNNNLSESSMRHWRYGQTPKIQSLCDIAFHLDTSIDYLVGRTDKA